MIRKLQLKIDDLAVESFATNSSPHGRGTVHGHGTPRCDAGSHTCDTVNFTCDGANTCMGPTCDNGYNTCLASCGACTTGKCTTGAGDLVTLGECVSGVSTCVMVCMNCF